MSPDELENALRAAQDAKPEYWLSRAALITLVRALPRPPAEAPVAWRHAYLQRVVEELCVFAPFDAVDVMLATQLIICRHAAADSMRGSVDAALPLGLTAKMRRCAGSLLRVAGQVERELRLRQKGRIVQRPVVVDVGLDLATLDAAWCRAEPRQRQMGMAAAVQAEAGGVVGLPPPVAPRAPTSAAARERYTMDGQRIDLVELETVPAAGTA
jgi:hypothetical protein